MAGVGWCYCMTKAQNIKQEMQSALEKGGSENVLESIKGYLDNWKNSTLNIGVTGRPGVGKSTFINTIRGLGAEDQGAAQIGFDETTIAAESFSHPDNENLVFWDLPGMGTPNFPRATYFTDPRVQFDRYDMFLVLCSERFVEDDFLLAKKIKAQGRVALFVRTKVDVDVTSARKQLPNFFKEDPNATDKILEKIRNSIAKGLKDECPSTEEFVFLIECLDRTCNEYDFGKLINRLVDELPALQREALIMTLNILSSNVLEKKVAVLRARIWQVSTVSALGAAVPLPGTAFVVGAAAILMEVQFYQTQLGVSKAHIAKAARSIAMNVDEFQMSVGIPLLTYTLAGVWTTSGRAASTKAVSEAAKYFAKWVVPVIGSAVAATAAAASTYSTLTYFLNMMEADAKRMQSFMLAYVEKKLA